MGDIQKKGKCRYVFNFLPDSTTGIKIIAEAIVERKLDKEDNEENISNQAKRIVFARNKLNDINPAQKNIFQ